MLPFSWLISNKAKASFVILRLNDLLQENEVEAWYGSR